jgi:hypothetical protein
MVMGKDKLASWQRRDGGHKARRGAKKDPPKPGEQQDSINEPVETASRLSIRGPEELGRGKWRPIMPFDE